MAATSPQPTIAELHAYLASLDSAMLVEADGWLATHVPPRKVWGVEAIAKEIDVARSTAALAIERLRDPLPVEYYGDRVWAYASALRAWMRRNSLPYQVHKALLAKGRARTKAKTANAVSKRAANRAAASDANGRAASH